MEATKVQRSQRYGEVGGFPEGSTVAVSRFAEHVTVCAYEYGDDHRIKSIVLDTNEATQLAQLLAAASLDAALWTEQNR